eukprot:4685356-Karenia_brevis.AAC.1
MLFVAGAKATHHEEVLEDAEEEMAGAEPADTLFVSAESPRPFGDDSDHRFLAGIRFRQSAEIRAVR